MEWKIGEIFEFEGEWYQCIPDTTDDNCNNCFFQKRCSNITGDCSSTTRSDGKSVAFKKLEKVGEPFTVGRELCQHYKVFDIDNVCGDVSWNIHNYKAKTILIELKQNKENMEEGNNTKYSNSENIGKNLKAFDLQAAKSGKHVCTRDGRKAVFLTTLANKNFPVVAIVSCGQEENIYQYDINGICDEHDENLDLMMLPEKKEGWVNVYHGLNGISERVCGDIVSKTKEEAIQYAQYDDSYITTVKISWEE